MSHCLFPVLLVAGLFATLAPVSASGRAEGSIQKTWDYPAGITTLVIDADRQDVVLKEGTSRLTGRLVGESSDEVKTVRDGATLTLTVRGERGWFSWRRKAARIELSVPPELTVTVTTASGAILVEVRTVALSARSASGDIEAPRGGKTADVDSTSGTVRLKGFTGAVKAATLSGDLLLEDLSGTIQAATLSGDLEGRDLRPGDRSRFTTVSGDADLTLTGGSQAYRVRGESVSGDLEIGDQRAEHALTAGEGPEVVLKTVTGDVRVR